MTIEFTEELNDLLDICSRWIHEGEIDPNAPIEVKEAFTKAHEILEKQEKLFFSCC